MAKEKHNNSTEMNLYNRHLGAIRKNNTHLEQNPKRIPNVVRIKLLEALGAVPALKQKRFANGGLGEALLELASLAGEDDRRERAKNAKNGLELIKVRIFGELERFLGFPRFRRPIRGSGSDMGGRRRRRNGRGSGAEESGGGRGDEMWSEREAFGGGSCREGGGSGRREICRAGDDHSRRKILNSGCRELKLDSRGI